jgi:hypothetical protein
VGDIQERSRNDILFGMAGIISTRFLEIAWGGRQDVKVLRQPVKYLVSPKGES